LPPEERAKFMLALRKRGYKDETELRERLLGDKIRNPADWVKARLGEHAWSVQRQIMESVRDNRKTAVPSCHGAGKSWLSARIAAWWIESHPPGTAFVVTSAPSQRQVKGILWKELARAHAKGGLAGRLNQTEWFMTMPEGNEELVATGIKPADYSPTAFQGWHTQYMLVIFDEACGVLPQIWESADSLTSGEDCRFLAIGNPDDPATEFAECCKPGSDWNTIHISAFDTPNFTGEWVPEKARKELVSKVWVEEKQHKWGDSNPSYIARVLGQFPDIAQDTLIQISWVRAAQERPRDEMGLPKEIGVDVGGGGDESTICLRHGNYAKIAKQLTTPDTMQVLGEVYHTIKRTGGVSRVKVDSVGLGWGLVNRAQEVARDPSASNLSKELARCIEGVNVSESAADPDAFLNLRAEGFWLLRERFREGAIALDPKDEDLAAQLIDIRYRRTSMGGKIQIESKDEMKARGKPSPNDADALMLAFVNPPPPKKKKKKAGTWGRRKRFS
jgi:hypothetical protein